LNHNSVRKTEEANDEEEESLDFKRLPKGQLNPIRLSHQHMTRQVYPVFEENYLTSKYGRESSLDSAMILPEIGTKKPAFASLTPFEQEHLSLYNPDRLHRRLIS
jgi:hypothetical protein